MYCGNIIVRSTAVVAGCVRCGVTALLFGSSCSSNLQANEAVLWRMVVWRESCWFGRASALGFGRVAALIVRSQPSRHFADAVAHLETAGLPGRSGFSM